MLGGDGRKKNGVLVRELVVKLVSLIPLRLNFATTFGSRAWVADGLAFEDIVAIE
jgi:hypothetical protein